MNRNDLDKRLRELGIYSDYYYRKEMKALCELLHDGESLNCIFTGVNEANRKLVAISDEKVLVIFGGALGSGDVRMIKRSAVSSYCFTKRFLRSSVSVVLPDETLEFTGVQAARKDLFDWAMARPVPAEESEQ